MDKNERNREGYRFSAPRGWPRAVGVDVFFLSVTREDGTYFFVRELDFRDKGRARLAGAGGVCGAVPGPCPGTPRGVARQWPNSRVRHPRIAILVVSDDEHCQSVDCSDDGAGYLPGCCPLGTRAPTPQVPRSLVPLCKCLRRCMCHQMPTRCAAGVTGLTPTRPST